jgi:hypothetical protein
LGTVWCEGTLSSWLRIKRRVGESPKQPKFFTAAKFFFIKNTTPPNLLIWSIVIEYEIKFAQLLTSALKKSNFEPNYKIKKEATHDNTH